MVPPASASQALDRGRGHHAAGRLDEALAAYREVVAGGGEPAEVATAHNNACVILTGRSRYEEALAECTDALRLRRELGGERGISRTLNNLGLVRQSLGDYEAASGHFREALAINRRRGDAAAQAVNLGNLGGIATMAGRYAQALEHHAAAEELAARHADEPWAATQTRLARINQAVVLEKLGALQEALELYRRARQDGEALGPRRRAALAMNEGVVLRNLGDPVSAAARFREAAEAFGGLGDSSGESAALLNLGLTHHLDLGRPRAAEALYRRALAIARRVGDRGEEIRDGIYLGRLLLERGELDAAAELFTRGLAAAGEAVAPEGEWPNLEGLGRVAEARDRPREALERYRQAMGAIESIRAGLRRADLRSGYLGDKRPVYAAAVRVLAGLAESRPGSGHAAAALAVVQRAKVRELLEALGGGGGAPLEAGAIAEAVGGGRLLEFFLGEGRLYRWSVTADEVRFADRGPSAPLLAAAAEVHRALTGGRPPAPEHLDALSAGLLGGLSLEPGQALRIAPDGALRHLPFELLRAGGAPLLERAAITYLPSGSALGWLRSERPPGSLSLAGLANPLLPGPAEGGGRALQLLTGRFRLGPLPGAEREVRVAAGYLGGEALVRTGREATEAAFREAVAAGPRVLHLATHAVLDDGPGRTAAVLLTPEGPDDGLLWPREIAPLDLPARLTVLASCRSAVSAPEEGRALDSLTGAFLAAGSAAVLATLWDVDDTASAALLEQFYHGLGRGQDPAEALRRAKARLRSEPGWDAPHLWAGFVLIGLPAPVAAPAPGPALWIAAGVLISGGLLLLGRRRGAAAGGPG